MSYTQFSNETYSQIITAIDKLSKGNTVYKMCWTLNTKEKSMAQESLRMHKTNTVFVKGSYSRHINIYYYKHNNNRYYTLNIDGSGKLISLC